MSFDLTAQLRLGDDWVDITDYTRLLDTVQITRGRAEQAEQADASNCTLTINNRTGDFSPRNPVGAYYGGLGRNTQMRILVPTTDSNYIALPGGAVTTEASGVSCATTPDVAALDIVGDLDVRVDVEPCSWRPGHSMGLACKYVNSAANKLVTGSTVSRSWRFWLDPLGYLVFSWNPTGGIGDDIVVTSTIPIPASSGRLAVRFTIDVNLSGTDRVIRFYTAPNLSGTYILFGSSVQTVGVTSIHSGSADLDIGRSYAEISGGSQQMLFQGKVYGAEVRNGIAGSLVASPDFRTLDVGEVGLTDAQTRVWALRANATMANPGARIHCEVPAWPQRWDKRGNDAYVPIQGFGVMRRLGQGQAPLKSVFYRALTRLGSVVGYWPCEDGDDASEIASAIPDGLPMNVFGEIETGNYDGFKASDPLPTTSGAQWTGTVPKYTSTGQTQACFLMAVPAAGEVGGGGWNEVWRARAYGTAPLWVLSVSVAGSLRLQAFNEDNTQIHDSGAMAFGVNGKKLRVSVEFDHFGSSINWTVATLEVGQTSGSAQSGTLASRTLGRIQRIGINTERFLTETAIGHISVHDEIASIYDLSDQLNAYSGELATDRILRLCREESVPVTVIGDVGRATALGAQLSGQLVDLLREAADSDLGILYEPREFMGLAYRTRVGMYSQAAGLTLNYTAKTITEIEPTEDDDAIRNDVTVTRVDGSSARVEKTDGPLSVAQVGRYDEGTSVSLESDLDLQNQANWRLHLGTVDEARFPVLGFSLGNASFKTNSVLTAAAIDLDIGARLVVTNLPAGRVAPGEIQQIAQGMTEVLSQFDWIIDVNCSPASPWDVALWNDTSGPGEARYSSDGTTITEDLTTTETGINISTPTGPVWSTTATPFDIVIGGERMTVTTVTGVSAAQVFTVTRSVNGIVKTHANGAAVALFKPAIYAL